MEFKNRRRRAFTQIDNEVLQNNSKLSWKAKGILAVMLSFPDDWSYSIADLIKRAKDGRDSLYGGLKELENAGYLKREQTKDKKGKITGIVYYVSDLVLEINNLENIGNDSTDKPCTENPNMESNKSNRPHTEFPEADNSNVEVPITDFPYTDDPYPENPPLQRINNTNTNNTNINQSKLLELCNASQSITDDRLKDLINYENVETKIKTQIEYESLKYDCVSDWEVEVLDNIVGLITEIMTSKRSEMKIAGEYRDLETIKRQFKKIDSWCINDLLNKRRETPELVLSIKNPKNYWLSALYNEPMTNRL